MDNQVLLLESMLKAQDVIFEWMEINDLENEQKLIIVNEKIALQGFMVIMGGEGMEFLFEFRLYQSFERWWQTF